MSNRILAIAVCAFVLSDAAARAQPGLEPVRAKHGMVATSSEIASQVGVDVLKKGGNAVDAAVAVAFALAVTHPSAGNIGGGGFMLVRMADGRSTIIDYRETAPAAAHAQMYLDADGSVTPNASTRGYRAAGVPGTVAGLALARDRFGTKPWADLVEPARRLAADGFVVPRSLALDLREEEELLAGFPESHRIFCNDGRFFEPGDTMRQPDLAKTLERLKEAGPREFYEGRTATLIADDMKANGGHITLEDLKGYSPVVREPLRGSYRGLEIMTMPPPSSGGVALLQMLQMLEPHDLRALGANSSAADHLMIEAMRRAFADRAYWMGDPEFVNVPVKALISKEYASRLAASIKPDKATPSADVRHGEPTGHESSDTTHFCVVDAQGNLIANTYTLNTDFGSGATVRGAGFLLNNEMDDFTVKPGSPNAYGLIQGDANAIAPRKRPLSSMIPTVVRKDGEWVMVVGTPGGPTIINTVLQAIINVADHGMNVRQAIEAPRIHHQWMPDKVRWEPFGLPADVREALVRKGHIIADKPAAFGDAQIIMIDLKTGERLGASDPRSGAGAAVGY